MACCIRDFIADQSKPFHSWKSFSEALLDYDVWWGDTVLAGLEVVKCLEGVMEVDTVAAAAAMGGNLQILRYLHSIAPEVIVVQGDGELCCFAAESNHLECLQFLRSVGCFWDSATTWLAAEFGHLECLRYAVENCCPVDVMAYEMAAKNGHLAVLHYLGALDYEWNEDHTHRIMCIRL